jgi:hypothetical protein
MSWRSFLTSPPPTTGWLLEHGLLALLVRDRKSGVQGAVAALTDGAVEVGPVGLQSIDVAGVAEAAVALRANLGGSQRAAVVVPTSWVRTHLLEFDTLPRGAEEVDEVVRWRLKKLLPVRPADLRIAAVPQNGRGPGPRSLIVMVGLERAFSDLEQALGQAEVVPGLVTSRLYALGLRPSEAPIRVVVQQEAGFLSVLVLEGGVARLVRTKPLAIGEAADVAAVLEMRLGLSFIRSTLELTGPLVVDLVADEPELAAELAEWWQHQEGVTVSRPRPDLVDDPLLAGRLGPSRLAPLLATLGGWPA